MPDVQTLILSAGMCAFLAAAVTQVGRAALARLATGCPGDPFWWNWTLRLISLVAGTAWGVLLVGGWWGAAAGVAGGMCATAVVAAVKSRVRRWADSGGPDTP